MEFEWGMYQNGSEYTCRSPSASKEQRKKTTHLPAILKLLLPRREGFTALSCTKLPEAMLHVSQRQ